jgi:segregation and condensation protein A
MNVDRDDGFMISGDAAGASEPTAELPEGWLDETGKQGAKQGDEALYLELDGWEGPLDLLLDLARRQ